MCGFYFKISCLPFQYVTYQQIEDAMTYEVFVLFIIKKYDNYVGCVNNEQHWDYIWE